MLLSKEAILGAMDLATKDVSCPEWGGDVRVRALTSKERDAYEAKYMDKTTDVLKIDDQFRAPLVILAAIDENFRPLFEPKDLDALSKKSSAPIDRLFHEIAALSGMKKGAREEAKKDLPESDSSPSS